jgi:hypothetical protein
MSFVTAWGMSVVFSTTQSDFLSLHERLLSIEQTRNINTMLDLLTIMDTLCAYQTLETPFFQSSIHALIWVASHLSKPFQTEPLNPSFLQRPR